MSCVSAAQGSLWSKLRLGGLGSPVPRLLVVFLEHLREKSRRRPYVRDRRRMHQRLGSHKTVRVVAELVEGIIINETKLF